MSFFYSQTCFKTDVVCYPNAKYRTIDGSCNNLQKPWLGMAGVPYSRKLPSRYRDNIQLPLLGLPSARLVRESVLPDHYFEDRKLTQTWMQFGQLITHDVMLTFDNGKYSLWSLFFYFITLLKSAANIDCCRRSNSIPNFEDKCLPIRIPAEDEFYSNFGVRCINLVRHKNTFLTRCNRAKAEQVSKKIHPYHILKLYQLILD